MHSPARFLGSLKPTQQLLPSSSLIKVQHPLLNTCCTAVSQTILIMHLCPQQAICLALLCICACSHFIPVCTCQLEQGVLSYSIAPPDTCWMHDHTKTHTCTGTSKRPDTTPTRTMARQKSSAGTDLKAVSPSPSKSSVGLKPPYASPSRSNSDGGEGIYLTVGLHSTHACFKCNAQGAIEQARVPRHSVWCRSITVQMLSVTSGSGLYRNCCKYLSC